MDGSHQNRSTVRPRTWYSRWKRLLNFIRTE
uniref:Uncharacterized protein n=1 Tax=Siphoviridae sp. ctvNP11 TaxID=2825721 RepID=A0A8S5PDE6_9CAUD|nr:MAG TPA: hypothetical protein [Siphoviridae sp. ctvNP11]